MSSEVIVTEILGQPTVVGTWYPKEKLAICGKCHGETNDPEKLKTHFKLNHVIRFNSSLNENRPLR